MGDGGNSTEKRTRPKCGNSGNFEPAPLFEKGQSGNPRGRPKGSKTGIRASLRRLLKTNAPDAALGKLKATRIDVGDGTIEEAIAAVLAIKAMAGDLGAVKEIAKQTEKAIPAISMSARVEKEDLDPYIDSESQSNGDKPKASHTNTLSPNATEIAAALDRE